MPAARAASPEADRFLPRPEDDLAGLHFKIDAAQSMLPGATPSVQPTLTGLPVPVNAAGAHYISPRLRARMQEIGLNAADLSAVAGSGAGGRVTVEDFEAFMAELEQHRTTPASPMRIAVADSMRRSWTRPLATVGIRVNLDPLLAHRKQQPPTSKPAPRSTLCAPWPSPWPKTPPSPAGSSANASSIPRPSISASPWRSMTACWCPSSATSKPNTSPCWSMSITTSCNAPAPASSPPMPGVPASPPSPTSAPSASSGPPPSPCPSKTSCSDSAPAEKAPVWDPVTHTFQPQTQADLTLSFDHRVLDGGGAGRLLGAGGRPHEHPRRALKNDWRQAGFLSQSRIIRKQNSGE